MTPEEPSFREEHPTDARIHAALEQLSKDAFFAPNFAARVEARVREHLQEQSQQRPRLTGRLEASVDALVQEILALFPRFSLAVVGCVAVLLWYNADIFANIHNESDTLNNTTSYEAMSDAVFDAIFDGE